MNQELKPNNIWNQRSSEDDFKHIFTKYYAPLCAYALKIVKGKEMSEEVVQSLFLTLWEKKNKLNIANIKAYLYRAVYHKTLHLVQHQHIKQKYCEDKKNEGHEFPSPEEGIMIGEMYEAYQKTLESLPQNTRDIYKLSRTSELTYKEIASKLDISIKTVESHISKALKSFRICFDQMEK